MMVMDKTDGGMWKPSNEMTKIVGKNNTLYKGDRCEGTMIGRFYTKNGKMTEQFLPGTQFHTCYNCSSPMDDDNPETRVPLLLLVPSPSWNLNRLIFESMKNALSNVPKKWCMYQKECGTKRQYLKELSSADCLKMVRIQAESL
jgi:hypothetical protein